MQINIEFSLDDVVYGVTCKDLGYYSNQYQNPFNWYIRTMTVGKVQVEQEHGKYIETYMCYETGIGSGTCWWGKSNCRPRKIYATRERAQAYINRKQVEWLT